MGKVSSKLVTLEFQFTIFITNNLKFMVVKLL